MMETKLKPSHQPPHFIRQIPQPGTTTTDEALQWGEQCNQQHVSCLGDLCSLALNHLAYEFFVAASFSKNPAVSGEAYYRLWQLESEGRAPHSTAHAKENRKRGLVYLRLAAQLRYPTAQRLIALML